MPGYNSQRRGTARTSQILLSLYFVYGLCVNVWCTAATECQPNCCYTHTHTHIYIYIYIISHMIGSTDFRPFQNHILKISKYFRIIFRSVQYSGPHQTNVSLLAVNAEAQVLYMVTVNTDSRRMHSNFQHAQNRPNYAYTDISHVQWPLMTGSL
jgi:hypothetical protein